MKAPDEVTAMVRLRALGWGVRRIAAALGCRLFRRRGGGGVEVLLGHMGGPFWAGRDAGAWSIPKGLPEPGEDLLAAARREVREETGLSPEGPFLPLAPVRQAGGKVVHAWAVETDCDPATLRSNTFRVEWPRNSGRWRTYPEIDRAAWLALPEARERIVRGQVALIDDLERRLTGAERPPGGLFG